MLVGDNIYHRNATSREWVQEDSHHSSADGTPNADNLAKDTASDNVLISDHFCYFGKSAPPIPSKLLVEISYSNGINHRRFPESDCVRLLGWIQGTFDGRLNQVMDDPFDFNEGERRFAAGSNRIV